MMPMRSFGVCLLVLGCSSLAAGQEKPIARRDLPPSVEKTVATQSHGATITALSTEVEHGQTVYEVALIVDGHGKDISIDARGQILEIEEEVSRSDVPSAVLRGLEAAAGPGALGKIEALTKHDRIVAYESIVTVGRKHHEIQVGPDGKTLAHPE